VIGGRKSGLMQAAGIFPGGCLVAKILVADDNSNIQKMVGLALKDHGIEVVAVGNGEAAVRKISDIHPDLVLADVFMPVRNGYEVCKYVKDDPALAHIPVILLVGAFDPLDEQEAQRVGADGVLKKPFVPPDPLISMVKSALVRAGVAHAGFTPAKPVPEVPVEAPVEAPRASVPKPVVAKPVLPEFEAESFVDEGPVHPAAVNFGSGQQPVAFGSLLETPGSEMVEEETAVTAVPAVDRDWRTAEVEEEEEEEVDADAKPSWRRDAGSEDADDKAADSGGGWREKENEDIQARGKRQGLWTPTREKEGMTEAVPAEAAASSGLSDFRNIPSAPFSGEAWAAAIEVGTQNKVAVAEEEHPTPHASELEAMVGHAEEPAAQDSFVRDAVRESVKEPVAEEESFVSQPVVAAQVEEPVVAAVPAVPEPESTSVTPSWFSTPPSPWDAEAQKATRLASTWDAQVAPAPVDDFKEEPAPVVVAATRAFESSSEPDEIEVVSGIGASSVIPEAVETARDVVLHSSADVDMDAVVARVLARMSPDKLQEVTRELLKPVIEAIVREELQKRP
jgi:CheY-like chemotaxis protein